MSENYAKSWDGPEPEDDEQPLVLTVDDIRARIEHLVAVAKLAPHSPNTFVGDFSLTIADTEVLLSALANSAPRETP